MKKNVGGMDRVMRLVIGAFLIGLGLGAIRGKGGLFVAMLGLVPLITGITRFCALYAILNIDTSGGEQEA
jgi:hypothetical protein